MRHGRKEKKKRNKTLENHRDELSLDELHWMTLTNNKTQQSSSYHRCGKQHLLSVGVTA